MAVLDHNKNEFSWLINLSRAGDADLGVRILKGSLLALAGLVGFAAAIAADPIFNLFA